MYLFIGIMFELCYVHITLVMPNLPNNYFTYVWTLIHLICWLATMISFSLASCKDPGYLRKELDFYHLLKNFHADDMCPRCEVLTTPRSHHCNICDRCVEGWDHHCPWIDNCVGVRNHKYFLTLLISICLLFICYIEPPISSVLLANEYYLTDIYQSLCVGC